MGRWILLRKGADFHAIGQKFHINPRLACLIRNRDVVGEEAVGRYLNGTVEDLYDGLRMKDMDAAAAILEEKIRQHKKIRVIGDYDIDGINATYILLEAIELLGGEVDSDIPDRIVDGYGLNVNLVRRAYEEGIDTIITCDNGIAAAKEIAYGKSLGMTVIVTDHHEVPYDEAGVERVLPPADAVVDPKRPDCGYPFRGLCGAAIAYKLVRVLCEAMGKDAGALDYLIENVAIATVGDVMDLEDENRILVKEGLRRLGQTSNDGLLALMECTNLEKDKIRAYHIGYVLGPCLNASGRLDTAKKALALLRAKNPEEAERLADELKTLNDSRKEMTETAVAEAKELAETEQYREDRVLVLYLPRCHESLAGIVAGRIREAYYKPVFVLTDAENGVKGSGRSIEEYHMFEELSKCKELFTKFGGHKLAAGLSLQKENVETLRWRLNENCGLTEEDLTEKVVIDMELPFSCVMADFIEELSLLEPFGKGNTKPVFGARNVEFLSGKIIGKNHNVLKLRAMDASGTTLDAMCFNQVEEFTAYLKAKYGERAVDAMFHGRQSGITLTIAYYPELNEYMGRVTPQIILTHYK